MPPFRQVAPGLFDEFRAREISLEVILAFPLGADHVAQLAVWRQLKENSYIQPYTVRRLLTETAISLDSDLGMFVGADAYEAAGGNITRDLFSGDEYGFMDDAVLVRRLSIEKLEAKAAELRPQWAWTKAVLDPEFGFLAQYARVRPQPGELPPELAAEIERSEQRLGELDDQDIPEDDSYKFESGSRQCVLCWPKTPKIKAGGRREGGLERRRARLTELFWCTGFAARLWVAPGVGAGHLLALSGVHLSLARALDSAVTRYRLARSRGE